MIIEKKNRLHCRENQSFINSWIRISKSLKKVHALKYQWNIDPSTLGKEAAEYFTRNLDSELNLLQELTEDLPDNPDKKDRADFFREYFIRKQLIEEVFE